jgi:hypothetical protein
MIPDRIYFLKPICRPKAELMRSATALLALGRFDDWQSICKADTSTEGEADSLSKHFLVFGYFKIGIF